VALLEAESEWEFMADLQQRMLRAAKLDVELYREVESDPAATGQATAVVALSALAAAVGPFETAGLTDFAIAIISALLGWYALAYIAYFVGAKFVPEPETNTTPEQLLRTIGFAHAPGVIRFLALIPGFGPPVFIVALIWMLVAMVVAVRETLRYRSTGRAIGVCVLSQLLQGFVLVAFDWLFRGL
jgi:hypothetical protein